MTSVENNGWPIYSRTCVCALMLSLIGMTMFWPVPKTERMPRGHQCNHSQKKENVLFIHCMVLMFISVVILNEQAM